jgi:hypothetical protein
MNKNICSIWWLGKNAKFSIRALSGYAFRSLKKAKTKPFFANVLKRLPSGLRQDERLHLPIGPNPKIRATLNFLPELSMRPEPRFVVMMSPAYQQGCVRPTPRTLNGGRRDKLLNEESFDTSDEARGKLTLWRYGYKQCQTALIAGKPNTSRSASCS